MKLSILFLLNAIFAAMGAAVLILMPAQTMASYGASLNEGGVFLAHIMGVTILGIAVLSYLVRNVKDGEIVRPVLMSFVIAHGGSFLFALMAMTGGVLNQMTWFDVIAHGAFAAGFGYYLLRK